MRKVTRGVAFDDAWDATRAAKVAGLFDEMAPEWAGRADEARTAVVVDALQRAALPTDGVWLELGTGTGAATPLLQQAHSRVVVADLSAEMLRHNQTDAPKVRCDASSLPHPAASVSVIVMVNMLLFPAEVNRVLAADGVVLWINTLGDQTPIHLPPQDVLAALPGHWDGVTANAGSGLWLAAKRA